MVDSFDLALGALLVLYAAVIARQLLLRGPPLSVFFLTGGAVMIALGVLTPQQALGAVNFSVLVFLFSMFVFAVALEKAGVLTHLASWLLARGGTVERLPTYLFVGFGLLSAFLVNDAIVLLSVPLMLSLAKRAKVPPIPLLLTIAYAVTVGSVMTPLGNPQNALVALSSGISSPFSTFARYLVLPTLLNLAIGGYLVGRWFGPELSRAAGGHPEKLEPKSISFFPASPAGGWWPWIRRRPSVLIFPGTVSFLLFNDLGSSLFGMPALPIWAIALAGALLLLLLHPAGKSLLDEVDWDTLLLFVGLFVVMGAVSIAGLFAGMGNILPIPAATAGHPSAGTLAGVLVSSVLGSQVLSNVPWTALSIPFLQHLGYGSSAPEVWMALAAGSTLAGNLTLMGAASNLIVLTQAERAGVKISFYRFVRYGVPLTLITVAVTFGALLVGI